MLHNNYEITSQKMLIMIMTSQNIIIIIFFYVAQIGFHKFAGVG